MAEQANTVKLDAHALIAILLKHHKIHEGFWMLQVHFTFNAGNVGPTEASVTPTAMVGISHYGLLKVDKLEPSGLVLDAAVVNPAPQAKKPRAAKP
jgi:hypothetical protein